FIVWVKNDEEQHICFMDPKGLQHQINVDGNNKVQFSKDIKEYEMQLNKKSGRDNIFLHSFIISETSLKKIEDNNPGKSKTDFNEIGPFFREGDKSHVDGIFRQILNKEKEVSY